MKRFLILSFATAILTSTMCFSQISSQIVGSWSMVYMKYTFPDGRVWEKSEFKYPSLKIFTKTYYSYGNVTEEGFLQGSGGGKYTIKGDTLIARYNYNLSPELMNKVTRLHIVIKGNRLFQKGVLPGGLLIEEEYIRLE